MLSVMTWMCTRLPLPKYSVALDAAVHRPAAQRQGDQLRPDLRHERVWPGQADRRRPQAIPGVYRPLLRPLPWRVLAQAERTRAQAAEQGYVDDHFGRLYLPDINAKNPALRKVLNVDGDQRMDAGHAADIIKKAMVAWITGWPRPGLIRQSHPAGAR